VSEQYTAEGLKPFTAAVDVGAEPCPRGPNENALLFCPRVLRVQGGKHANDALLSRLSSRSLFRSALWAWLRSARSAA
jgi:hypothetical protein